MLREKLRESGEGRESGRDLQNLKNVERQIQEAFRAHAERDRHGNRRPLAAAVQRSALCRSRRELSNAYLLAKFRFDTAENEPCQAGSGRGPGAFLDGSGLCYAEDRCVEVLVAGHSTTGRLLIVFKAIKVTHR